MDTGKTKPSPPKMSFSSQIHLDKKLLRNKMRTQLDALGTSRDQSSALIRAQIVNHPAWVDASTVGLFAPLPQEPDLLGLLAHSAKRFVFPCVETGGLLWRTASGPNCLQPVQRSIGRLTEPVQGEPIDLGLIDCLIVPGLAFSRCGKRLGRGGGYYDRTLASIHPRTTALGVCFSAQIVETLPCEPHDRSVHQVIHA
jgi:5-formyltetrahydrofolate cyclo-ligase